MRRITICICVCSPSCRFSASHIRNIGKFGAKKYFLDHRKVNAIQLFVPIKREFFGPLLFQNKPQRRGILQGLLDKYRHLFFCIYFKWTLISGGKPFCTVKILVPEQIAFSAVLYVGQVSFFYRLINKSVLEGFLLIMCN